VLSDFDLKNVIAQMPGATFKQIDSAELTPEAGSEIQQSCWKMFRGTQEAKRVRTQRREGNTTKLSEFSGHTQGRISQIANERFNGWKSLRKLLVSLTDIDLRETNNLDDTERFLAKTYFPLLLKDEEVDV
jgi:hypothetical protein